jgi:hypothetical protein
LSLACDISYWCVKVIDVSEDRAVCIATRCHSPENDDMMLKIGARTISVLPDPIEMKCYPELKKNSFLTLLLLKQCEKSSKCGKVRLPHLKSTEAWSLWAF